MTIETKAVPHTATIDVFVGDQIETFDLADLDFSNHTEMTLVTLGLYDQPMTSRHLSTDWACSMLLRTLSF